MLARARTTESGKDIIQRSRRVLIVSLRILFQLRFPFRF